MASLKLLSRYFSEGTEDNTKEVNDDDIRYTGRYSIRKPPKPGPLPSAGCRQYCPHPLREVWRYLLLLTSQQCR